MKTDYERAKKECEAVRRSGKTNMFECGNVQRIAVQTGLPHLAEFIADCSSQDYAALLEEAAEEWREAEDDRIDSMVDRINQTRVTKEIK